MKTIRRIAPADLGRVSVFSAEVYRRNNIIFSPKYFSWAFENTLGQERAHCHGAMMALLDERIIGTFVGVAHEFNALGRVEEGLWIHDWFTEQGHGATGLQLAMSQLRQQWFFGASGHGLQGLSVLRAAHSNGFWFELERLIGVIDPRQTALLSMTRSNHTEAFLRTIRIATPDSSAGLRQIDCFDLGYERIWNEMRPDILFATHRTARYMNWRYLEHPYFVYECAVSDSPAGTAYFVWRNEKIAGQDIVVSRLCEAIGTPQSISQGFPAAFRSMADAGAAFVDFFCSNSTVNAALAAAGMLPAVSRPELDLARLFQPLEASQSKSLDFSAFFPLGAPGHMPFDWRRTYITKGDSNQDRPNPA